MAADETKKKDVVQDVLAELLTSAQRDETIPDAEDLNALLYRDPKEISERRHRSFRLSNAYDDLGPAGRAALVDEDRDEDVDQELRSFRLAQAPRNKKKATVYFPKKLHTRLRSAKYQVKKLVPPEMRSYVTMSDIVTIALRIALREFEMKGKNSLMLKLLVKNIQRKM